jgi:hypothetical protein
MILASHGIVGSQIVQFNPNVPAQEFYNRVTAAGGSLTSTEEAAILQLITDLNNYGIWTKMKAIYPMVGASAPACAQNLKSSSFTGTFNGGITYTSNGVAGNGTTGYMDTGIIPSSHLNLNNVHLSFYSRTNNVGDYSEMGANDGADNRLQMTLRFSSVNYNAMNNNVTQFSYTGSSAGLFIASRISSSQFKSFRNATILNTTVSNSQNLTSKEIILLATNNNGVKNQWSNRQCAFASMGDGLTDTEASNFYTSVQAFQTTLSRQV